MSHLSIVHKWVISVSSNFIKLKRSFIKQVKIMDTRKSYLVIMTIRVTNCNWVNKFRKKAELWSNAWQSIWCPKITLLLSQNLPFGPCQKIELAQKFMQVEVNVKRMQTNFSEWASPVSEILVLFKFGQISL